MPSPASAAAPTFPASATPDSPRGILAGCAAHLIWGVAVLFWPLLGDLPAVSILSHRIMWSCVFLFGVLALTGRLGEVLAALRDRRTLATLALCSALLSVNWGLFLWAVNRGNVVECSLGYFITPLLNVLMGRIFLGERLSRAQGFAILLAAAGVLGGVIAFGHVPWLALILALTFAVYGYLQKTVRVEAGPSLFMETAILFPLALGWLAFAHPDLGGLWGRGMGRTLLLTSTCLFTAVPLLMFSYAARHIQLATVGIIQYVSPSLNFLLAVLVTGEAVKPSDALTFPLIWIALAVYTVDALRSMRALRARAARDGGATPVEEPST